MTLPTGASQPDSPALSDLLNALRDPTRRRILLRLLAGECKCSGFADLGSKTALSYHFASLRAVGLTQARREGTFMLLSLQTEAVEAAFPGLLDAVLAGTLRESPAPAP